MRWPVGKRAGTELAGTELAGAELAEPRSASPTKTHVRKAPTEKGRWGGGSLRGRVTRTTLLVVGGVLVALLVAVDLAYGALARQQVTDRLTDRARFAWQMDVRDVPAQRIVRRVSGAGVDAQLVNSAGRRYLATGFYAPGDFVTVTRELPRSGRLTLTAGTGFIQESQLTLRVIITLTALVALAATALLLPLASRRTTRPMDELAGLARAVAAGERGRRLSPERTDTELGRTAAAFDAMLEALESAETRSRESESRYRHFLADVAHELRTPLAGVQASAESALHAPADQPRAESDRVHVMLAREARRAGRLVDDLLLLARVDSGLDLHYESVDISSVCVAEAERCQLRKRPAYVVVSGAAAPVPADAHRIGQVIANLLENAAKHGRCDRESPVRITVSDTAGYAIVDVADDGPGVPPSQRELIFHRFVRQHSGAGESTGGAGLGLSIARGIARAHGGDLRCETSPLDSPDNPGSADNPGAVFRLVLPHQVRGRA